MSTVHKTASRPTAVQELYAYYRVAREFGDTPDLLEIQIAHDARKLPGEAPGQHTVTSFGKAYEMGDPTWTALNEVDRRYKRKQEGRPESEWRLPEALDVIVTLEDVLS